MAFENVADFSGSYRQGLYAPQLQEQAFQQGQQKLQAQQLENQQRAFQLQQAQRVATLQQQYMEALREEQPTPTAAQVGSSGEIISPELSDLYKQRRAAIKADPSRLEEIDKRITDTREKESAILKNNLALHKERSNLAASSAQAILDSNGSADIVDDALDTFGTSSPQNAAIAAKFKASLIRGLDGNYKLTPKQKQELSFFRDMNREVEKILDSRRKQLIEEETKRHHKEIESLERKRIQDREKEQAARREERIAAREEKSTSKSSDYKAASRQADSAHARYQRRYDSLKKALRTATTEDEKKLIQSDMVDLNLSYEEEKDTMRREWADKGLNVKWPGESKPPLEKSSAGKSKDSPMEISSEEEASKLPKGTWIKMGNRVGQVK